MPVLAPPLNKCSVGYPRKHRRYLELRPGESLFSLQSWEELVIPLRPARPLAAR
jgi:hypothetical protein